jgi:CheY-like chemotaxis protein
MDRRQHDRIARPGRRRSDRRSPAADNRRALLVGPDESWRLLTVYLFEEAGYAVYAAADQQQAVSFTTRLLPDVVVVQMETPNTLDILGRLKQGSSTYDIPIVMLTSSLQSIEARRAREAGGVALLAHSDEGDVLVGKWIRSSRRRRERSGRSTADCSILRHWRGTTRRTPKGKRVCAT